MFNKAKSCENCKTNVCGNCMIESKFPGFGFKSSKKVCIGCNQLMKFRSHLKEGKEFKPKAKLNVSSKIPQVDTNKQKGGELMLM